MQDGRCVHACVGVMYSPSPFVLQQLDCYMQPESFLWGQWGIATNKTMIDCLFWFRYCLRSPPLPVLLAVALIVSSWGLDTVRALTCRFRRESLAGYSD